jgi:hypothetical protein
MKEIMNVDQIHEIMGTAVWIDYVDPTEPYHNSRAWHNVVPVSAYPPMRFEKTEKFPDEQWLLSAYDCKSGKVQDFAMKNIKAWKTNSEYHQLTNILG